MQSLEISDRIRLVDKVRRLGGATSDAVLDSATQIFTLPNIEGLIGYRIESSHAIVYGDPICSSQEREILVPAFHAYCHRNGWEVIYIAASEPFAKWAINHACKALIEFGDEIILDPHNDPRDGTGVYASLVRRKVRHAIKEEVKVVEYDTPDTSLEQAIEQVGESWLKARRGLQTHISHVRLFDDRPGKRWFYAKHGNEVVGVVVLNKLESRQGWLINHLMHTPTAPHGTPEYLLIAALEALKNEGCRYVTCGSSPSADLGEIIGLSSLSACLTRVIYHISKLMFKLGGKKKFWEKFNPQKQPSYLLFSHAGVGLKGMIALMRAVNLSMANSDR